MEDLYYFLRKWMKKHHYYDERLDIDDESVRIR